MQAAKLEAPAEVFFARARLRATPKQAKPWWLRLVGRGHDLLAGEYRVDSSHLYTIGLSPARYKQAVVDIDLSMRLGGLLVAAFLSSLLTTTILWTGIYLHYRGVGAQRTEATALLVVLPAVFAALLIPGEHPLTRRMFKGLRLLILLTAGLAFAAAALLALDLGRAPAVHLRCSISTT